MTVDRVDLLHSVARLYDLQTEYRDGLGQLRRTPAEAILQLLQCLGAPARSLDELRLCLRERRQTLWQRGIEPVTVAWQDRPLRIQLRLPTKLAETPVFYQIDLESGARSGGQCFEVPGSGPVTREVEGSLYVIRRLTLPISPPLGYHRLHLTVDAFELQSYLVSAPPHAYSPAESEQKRWGVFCPLYALHSERSWGAGDFSDLAALAELTGRSNGHAVATLPMLASFLDEPFNPSPYAPVSRLFWNEFFLDVTSIPEFTQCPAAQAIVNSAEFRRDIGALRAEPLVDYRKAMSLKGLVLEELSRFLLSRDSRRRAQFEKFVAGQPNVQAYAAFRAKVERERKSWTYWPPASRDGTLTPGDYGESDQKYHLYVQWQCAEQIGGLREKAQANGAGLYLDFPLGVNRDGYDVWRERGLFALEVNGGAPPDSLFLGGQNWGFPPLHPETIREQGYRYYIDCLRHHMACSAMLRIDHVMGLHRAFWIPNGFSPTDGLYVHYRAAEFYAIFNLESHRHRVRIVGENLGTVPGYVNEAMTKHKFLGMHVGQFGVQTNPAQALDRVPQNTVASLNTHDTATFMGFWSGEDIDERVALGLLDDAQARQEHLDRAAQRDALVGFLRAQALLSEVESDPAAVLKGWLLFIAGQDEDFLLVNLEDLWLEPAPQNVPGTWEERPNWKRKARFSLEEIRSQRAFAELLKTISDKRGRIG